MTFQGLHISPASQSLQGLITWDTMEFKILISLQNPKQHRKYCNPFVQCLKYIDSNDEKNVVGLSLQLSK